MSGKVKILQQVLLLLFLLIQAAAVDAANEADTLLIAFTANNNGQLLDCGCTAGVAGGLPRRLTAVKRLREKYRNVLLVDGGDFLGTVDRQLQNYTVIQAYQKFGYDAVALGDQEFWNGEAFFAKMVLNSRLPVLVSNLDGTFLPTLFLTRKAKKIEMRAFLHPGSFAFFDSARMPKLKWRNMQQSLVEMTADSENERLRIVIFHGEQFELAKLLPRFPQIDVWLVGHQTGKLSAQWQESRSPVVIYSDADGESIQLVQVIWPIGKQEKRYRVKRLQLTEGIPPDRELQSEINEYYNDLQKNLLSGEANMQRTAACRHCHLLAYETWRQTAHAKIENTGSALSRKKPVGCNVCHRISQRHGEYNFSDRAAVKEAKNCRRCHNKKSDPDFEFAKKWKLILH